MKKIMLVLAAATLIAGNTFAQYKPQAGSISTEVQFNPFDQDGNTFSLDGVKVRYFLDDNNALRLKLGLMMTSKTNKEDDSKDAFTNEKYGNFNLDLGYEYHFGLSKRIDLYAGAELGIFKSFASSKAEDNDGNVISKTTNFIKDNDDAIGMFGFGFGIFTGIDFYVYKGLYVGTELGFNITTGKSSEQEMEVGNTTTKNKASKRVTKYGFNIQPTLRLGWTF